jgi:hypothetical protein
MRRLIALTSMLLDGSEVFVVGAGVLRGVYCGGGGREVTDGNLYLPRCHPSRGAQPCLCDCYSPDLYAEPMGLPTDCSNTYHDRHVKFFNNIRRARQLLAWAPLLMDRKIDRCTLEGERDCSKSRNDSRLMLTSL